MFPLPRLRTVRIAALAAALCALTASIVVSVAPADARQPLTVVVDANRHTIRDTGRLIANVSLQIPAGTSIGAATLSLQVDGDLLQFQSRNGELLCRNMLRSFGTCGPGNSTDRVNFSFYEAAGLDRSRILFRVPMRAQGQAACDVPLTLTVATMVDTAGNRLEPLVVNDTVDIVGRGQRC